MTGKVPPPVPPPTPPSATSTTNPRAAWRSIAGFCIGAVLLCAAVWVVWKDRAQLSDAWDRARDADWWLIALLICLPWVSWTLTSVMYCTLMNRHSRRSSRQHVGLGEMHAVLASAWLMNYLPARPGMFGRLAYHKVVNDIPFRESVRASIVAIACGIASMLLLTGVTLSANAMGLHGPAALILLAAPALCAACLAAAVGSKDARRETIARTAWALSVRYLDVLSWMARYVVAYQVLGRPLSLVEAGAFTVVSQIAAMVPLVGNGLGIREWSEGLLGPRLTNAIPQQLALSAGLLNRAAEVVAALPVGLICGAWVARRMRQSGTPQSGHEVI